MTEIETLYGNCDQSLLTRLRNVRMLACDVDGVFSDGRIYLGNDGEELKGFHTRDGYGIKAIQKLGIQVAVITGRKSNIVQQRMSSLGVKHIIQGEENKHQALATLCQQLSLAVEQVAAMGDDVPDIGMYRHAGLKLAVQDAHPQVIKLADYVTTLPGGMGAVREICDLILQSHGALESIHGSSI